jgi:hypothetical protein
MIEFRTKFYKYWSSRKKTYIKKQIGLFCANKPSEVYPNTLPHIPYPYIYSLRTFVYIYQIYIYIPSGINPVKNIFHFFIHQTMKLIMKCN